MADVPGGSDRAVPDELGERLVAAGLLARADLERCLGELDAGGSASAARRARLPDLLLARGLVTETQIEAVTRAPAPRPSEAETVIPGIGLASPPPSQLTPRPPSSRRVAMPPGRLRPPSGRASVPPAARPDDRPSGRAPRPGGESGLDDEVRAALADPRRRIGRYVALHEVGRGGMARVIKAWDPSLRRPVAIKMILETSKGRGEEVERFAREGRAAARLRHPGIVGVHEVGDHGGRPFLVMDYIEGRPLDVVVAEETMTPRRIAELVREVALALDHAHGEGVLHRDVKPQNVIVDEAGRPHLTDFGLARDVSAVSTDRSLTVTGQMLGTPCYVAPEQARGQLAAIGPASDVYSLGGVLYHALVKRPPFDGATLLELLNRVFEKDPEPPRRIDPRVHPDLETIALRCLEKEPERRYPTARAVADELARFLSGEAIQARPIRGPERLRRWARRNRALSVTAGAASIIVVGLLLTGAVFAAYSFGSIARERDRAEAEKLRAQQAEADAEAAAEVARTARARAESESRAKDGLLGRALREKGERMLTDGSFAEGATLYAASLRIAESPEARSGIAQCLPRAGKLIWSAGGALHSSSLAVDAERGRVLVGTPRGEVSVFDIERAGPGAPATSLVESAHLLGHRREVSAAAPAPDGLRAATSSDDGTIVVWQLATGTPIVRLSGHLGAVNGVAWMGDGRLVSAGEDGTVRVWDVAAAATALTFTGHEGSVNAVAWSDETERLVSAGDDGTVRLWDVAGGDQARVLRGHEDAVYALAFAPGGRHVASGSADASARVWDLADGGRSVALGGMGAAVTAVAFDASGRRLLAAASDGAVRVFPIAPDGRPAGEASVVRAANGRSIEAAVFGPSGDWLLTASSSDGLRALDVATGRALGEEPGHRAPVWAVAWNADGTRLASGSADGSVRIWSAENGAPVATLAGHEGPVNAVCWVGDDGGLLASAGDDGTVRIWDATSFAELAALRGHASPIEALASDPRGARIASGDGVGELRVWDVATRRLVFAQRSHEVPILSVAFSPDGREVASGGVDAVRFWAEDGAPVATLRHAGAAVRYTDAGARVHVVEPDGRRVLWDTARRVELSYYDQRIVDHGDGAHEDGPGPALPERVPGTAAFGMVRREPGLPDVSIDIDRNGRFVVLGDDDDYNVVTASYDDTLAIIMIADGGTGATGFDRTATRVAFGGFGGSVQVWELPLGEGGGISMTQDGGGVGAAAMDAEGEWLATGGLDGRVRMWETGSSGRAVDLGRTIGPVTRIAFEPTGRRLAVAATEETVIPGMAFVQTGKTLVTLWEVSTSLPGASFEAHGGRVRALDWRASGAAGESFVASAGDDVTIRVWRPEGPDGPEAVAALDGHRGPVNEVRWSPDGRRLASASEDGTVRIWNADGWREERALRGHEGGVRGLAWSADGARIASSSSDQTVRVWDAASGRELRRLTRAVSVEAVGFGARSLLLFFENDGWLRIYDQDEAQLVSGLKSWGRDDEADEYRTQLCIGPRGKRLAIARQSAPSVALWDLEVLGLIGDPDELAERVFKRTGFRVQGLDAVPLRHRLQLR